MKVMVLILAGFVVVCVGKLIKYNIQKPIHLIFIFNPNFFKMDKKRQKDGSSV